MDLTIKQRTVEQGSGWWSWEVWIDGPEEILDRVEVVQYALPTTSNPRVRVTDRASGFALKSGGWAEFMIYAEVTLRDGPHVSLRHWLQFKSSPAAHSRLLVLVHADDDRPFAEDLTTRLVRSGFQVSRDFSSTGDTPPACAIAIVSSARLSNGFSEVQNAACPLLVIALNDSQPPPSLAVYRRPLKIDDPVAGALQWLLDILDRRPVPWDGESPLTFASAFWTRTCAIASEELKQAARFDHAPPAVSGSLVAVLARDVAGGLTVAPGWKSDLPELPPGAVLVSLEGEAVPAEEDFFERARTKPEDYINRRGYDPNFLGVPVPLPKTSQHTQVLKYTNFSVVQALDRRLSLYAVVNIDGAKLKELHRSGDPWIFDPRLPDAQQVGGKYYSGTPLDRGHMVRRIDPVWGPDHDQAELDTFHYTNSCPQHKNLNRKVWNDLEDYVYKNTDRDDMKVTVFTGPVLASDDRPFRGVPLPREFWKVVVIRLKNKQPSATAYLLSQEDMVRGLEFVFGEFRTFQVTVEFIEKKTGLNFGTLRNFDPKRKKAKTLEAAELPTEIRGPEDLMLSGGAEPEEPAPAWTEPVTAERRLRDALDTFDWTACQQLVDELVEALAHDPAKLDEALGRRVLTALQRKRRFASMTRVADALIQAGIGAYQVRRRYAQALIEQKLFHAAATVLRSIVNDPQAPPFEQEEAQGLLGRIGKQMYVDAKAPANARNVAHLQNAVDSYWLQYAVNPSENYWHAINVVACLHLAEVDGVRIETRAEPRRMAEEILANMQAREENSRTGELQAWELATRIEAHLALGQHAEAIRCSAMYANCRDADAFEIASTLRQFEQVWRLRDDTPPGDEILPLLRSALLKREGGELRLTPESARFELEKVFGLDRAVTLEWYRTGLDRAQSIARIETNSKGYGTAWLIDAGKLFDGRTGPLLVTNAHVLGPDTPDRYPDALRPEHATVHFQMQGVKMPAGKVVFHSPVNQCDATVIELPEAPPQGARPLPLDTVQLALETPPQRLYIIGYPSGRDLEFSLQDNHLLAASERLVHYRTPTEGGSSGSPVFGPADWKVVALHHAGRKDMPRLDGSPGSYEANEGIGILSLLKATRR